MFVCVYPYFVHMNVCMLYTIVHVVVCMLWTHLVCAVCVCVRVCVRACVCCVQSVHIPHPLECLTDQTYCSVFPKQWSVVYVVTVVLASRYR